MQAVSDVLCDIKYELISLELNVNVRVRSFYITT